eukprot:g557.t1
MRSRRTRTNTGRVNRSARGAARQNTNDVHLLTLKKRCDAKSVSMRRLFERWERRPDASLSHAEFFDTMRLANVGGVTKSTGAKLVAELDRNNSGCIGYGAFRRAVDRAPAAAAARPRTVPGDAFGVNRPGRAPRALFCGNKLRERVRSNYSDLDNAFRTYDVNRDGWLSRPEFAALMDGTNMGLSEMDLDVMVREADTNGDGKIDYGEFCKYLDPPRLRPDSTRAVSLFDAPEGFVNQPKYELRDRMLARRIHQPRHVNFGSVGRDAVWGKGERRAQNFGLNQTVSHELRQARMKERGPLPRAATAAALSTGQYAIKGLGGLNLR